MNIVIVEPLSLFFVSINICIRRQMGADVTIKTFVVIIMIVAAWFITFGLGCYGLNERIHGNPWSLVYNVPIIDTVCAESRSGNVPLVLTLQPINSSQQMCNITATMFLLPSN